MESELTSRPQSSSFSITPQELSLQTIISYLKPYNHITISIRSEY